MVLVQNWLFFQLFFFWQYRLGECVLRYSRTKMTFYSIKTGSLKNPKIEIFPKVLVHGFGPKLTIFSTFFLLAIQVWRMCFTLFQNRKTTFQATKTRSLKNPKIEIIFSKGVSPWFWSKIGHFLNFFSFGNIGQENVFYDILKP